MNQTVAWRVPADHPAFAGHFPGAPIVPGVMLLDTVIHAVANTTDALFDSFEIRSVKFLSPARPADELTIEFRLESSGTLHFEVRTGARSCASGEILCKQTSSNS
jgi:3-hydroxymyristoyl/3-hydroxydecanoyl-(acyl carrier protein) dehydratase